jgi:hypothetical protein
VAFCNSSSANAVAASSRTLIWDSFTRGDLLSRMARYTSGSFIRKTSIAIKSTGLTSKTPCLENALIAKLKLCRTIVLGSHAPEPMVNERGLPDPSPRNDRNDVLPDRLRSSNSPPRMSEDENENDSQISEFGSTAFIEFRSNLYSG